MNTAEGQGDTGLSRYPPAEGERTSQGGPGMNVGPVRDDTGFSTFPPAEGERNPPAEEPRPPSGAGPTEDNGAAVPPGPTAANSPRAAANARKGKGGADMQVVPVLRESQSDEDLDIFDSDTPASDATARTIGGQGTADSQVKRAGAADTRTLLARLGLDPGQTFGSGGEPADISRQQRDTGLSRYPPAEGVRSSPSAGAPAAAIGLLGKNEAAWYSAHAQATVVTQVHNVFTAPYTGPHSLKPSEPAANTMTGTVFYATRLCESERNDTQIIFNPEVAGGAGFSGTNGIAGFPNGEATRVGVENPTPYIARLYVRQTFGFGGGREWAPDDDNQVAGERDVRRLAVTVGKLAAPDVADDNRYAHDPRTQFLNWALVYNGAWDYPANVRGYTYGAALHYITKDWTFAYGVFAEPAVANGAPLDWHLLKAQGQVAELEERYQINSRSGEARFMVFLNHAHMGNYNEALQLMPVDPDITKTRSYRYKYGFCMSLDQALSDDIGFFSRLGWNDGHSESWAFTEIDRTASAGFVMGGRWWCRPDDRVGLAGVLNGISGPHRAYLEAGGLGFIIGDGKLKYGLEQCLETYYAWRVTPGIVVTLDFQEIVNPAYNTQRGPVEVGSLRVHWDH
jgi:high affinity Mn2+ porin